MAWLGNGLSQLKGQLSDLTKEVLTDSTEEVDDHVTELKVAKAKITELHAHCTEYKQESDRLQQVNDELTDRFESAELQISATHKEYREQIQLKDEELQTLRHQVQDLQHSRQGAPPTALHQSNTLATPAVLSEAHNFDDVISCQTEIYRLQNHVCQLEAQLQQQHSQDGTTDPHEASADHRIKDLENQLSTQLDSHQTELSTLQDLHRHKLSHFKQQYQESNDEALHLREQLDGLQQLYHELKTASETRESTEDAANTAHSPDSANNGDVDLLSESDFCDHIATQASVQFSTPMAHRNTSLSRVKVRESESGTKVRNIESDLLQEQIQHLQQKVQVQQEQLDDKIQEGQLAEEDWGLEKQALENVLLKTREQMKSKQQESVSNIKQKREAAANQVKKLGLETLHESLTSDPSDSNLDDKLLEELNHQVSKVNQLENELEKESDSSKNVTDEMSLLKRKMREKDDHILDLLEQIRTQKIEIANTSRLYHEVSSGVEMKNVDEMSTKMFDKEVSRIMVELEEKETSQLELEGELSMKEEELKDMRKQLKESMCENKKYSTENEKLQASMLKMTAEHKVELEHVTAWGERNRKKKEELTAGTETLKTEASEKSPLVDDDGENVEVQQELLSLKNEINVSRENFLKCNEELEHCNGVIDSLEMEISERDERMESMQMDVEQLDSLKEQLSASGNAVKDAEYKTTQLTQEIEQLNEQLTDLNTEKLSSSIHIEELLMKCDSLNTTHDGKMKECLARIDSLEMQKQDLENDLSMAEDKLSTQKTQYDVYIADMTKAQDLSSNSVEAENSKLLKSIHEKEQIITDLESKCEGLFKEMEQSKDTLQSALDGQTQISELLNERDLELTTVRAELNVTRETCEKLNLSVQKYKADLERTHEIEKKYKSVKDTNLGLQESCTELKNTIARYEKNSTPSKVEAKTLDVITDLESEISALNNTIESNSERLGKYERKIQELQGIILDKEASNQEQSDKIHQISTELKTGDNTILRHVGTIEALQMQITEQTTHIKSLSQNVEQLELDQQLQKEQAGGRPSGSADVKPVDSGDEELKKLLNQKDTIITELRNSNSSLMHLLEERSLATHGDKVLVEVHDLQSEVKQLKLEKDQMMSVLSEKSREASNLKVEVHRLMGIISAEKSALAKLQHDNNTLMSQKKISDNNDADTDMTRETVKNLSRIIRDKDLEIESLNLKNTTLLQVLQDSSGDSQASQLSVIIQERDNLLKQVTVFQQDREQIITALNHKHQESLAFHAELQRMNGIRSKEQESSDMLKHDYTILTQQYEDKSQALLKSQHDMMNYKHKLLETENRLNQMKTFQRQKREEKQKQQDEQEREIRDEQGDMNGEDMLTPSLDTGSGSKHVNLKERTKRVRQRMDSEELCELEIEVNQLKYNMHEKELEVSKITHLLSERNENFNKQLKDAESKLQDALQQRDQIFNQKDKSVCDLNAIVHKKDEMCRQKDSENSTLKKQVDSLTFELSGCHTDVTDLTCRCEQMQKKLESAQSELSELRDAYNRVTIVVGDKDHELDTLQEKLSALQRAMLEQGSGDVGQEVKRSLDEAESMHVKATQYRQERDQAYGTLQQQTNANEQLRQQCEQLKEHCVKLERELERLRGHLVQIEESYTQEALSAEQREKDLRTKLASAEENIIHSSTAMQNASETVNQQLQGIQQQLYAVAKQRDDVVMQLTQSHEKNTQYAASLGNLQMVLEQFQQERDLTQAAETEKFQRQLIFVQDEKNKLQQQVTHLQSEVDETQVALEAAQRLSEQLDKKQQTITALKEEVLLREHELDRREAEISRLTSHSQSRVDKQLMRSLFLGYFHSSSHQKSEVLQLVAKILEFTADEMKQLLDEGQGQGWLRGWFHKTAPSVPNTPTRRKNDQSSFSELFVNFLERESTPKTLVALPAEQMAEQQQQKQRQKAVAFNPFNAPRHASLPPVPPPHAGAGAAPGLVAPPAGPDAAASHPLIAPSSPTLPLYQPVFAEATSVPQNFTPQIPQLQTPQATLQATPSSSAILEDVLQR